MLIYDKYCRDLISPLLKVAELKQMNVTLYMMLHSDRDAIPDCPAIYFCLPTEDNIDRICQDCKDGLYESVHLNFASPLPAELMQKLADTAVSADSVSRIEAVYDQYTNFISLEPTLFSLGQRDAYRSLNDPKAAEVSCEKCTCRERAR